MRDFVKSLAFFVAISKSDYCTKNLNNEQDLLSLRQKLVFLQSG